MLLLWFHNFFTTLPFLLTHALLSRLSFVPHYYFSFVFVRMLSLLALATLFIEIQRYGGFVCQPFRPTRLSCLPHYLQARRFKHDEGVEQTDKKKKESDGNSPLLPPFHPYSFRLPSIPHTGNLCPLVDTALPVRFDFAVCRPARIDNPFSCEVILTAYDSRSNQFLRARYCEINFRDLGTC